MDKPAKTPLLAAVGAFALAGITGQMGAMSVFFVGVGVLVAALWWRDTFIKRL